MRKLWGARAYSTRGNQCSASRRMCRRRMCRAHECDATHVYIMVIKQFNPYVRRAQTFLSTCLRVPNTIYLTIYYMAIVIGQYHYGNGIRYIAVRFCWSFTNNVHISGKDRITNGSANAFLRFRWQVWLNGICTHCHQQQKSINCIIIMRIWDNWQLSLMKSKYTRANS